MQGAVAGPAVIAVGRERLLVSQMVWIGIGCTLLGLFPWLITGMRLPLQNLWNRATLPDDMPRALLPMNQYAISTLVGLIVLPYVVAAVVRRIITHRLPDGGARSLVLTIVAAQLLAIMQTSLVVFGGIRRNSYGLIYTFGMGLGLLVAIGYGLIVYRLMTDRSRNLVSVGVALAAVPFAAWLNALLNGAVTSSNFEWLRISFASANQGGGVVRAIAQFIIGLSPAVLVGIAIGWTGLHAGANRISAIVAICINW